MDNEELPRDEAAVDGHLTTTAPPWWQRYTVGLFDSPAYKDPLAYWAVGWIVAVVAYFLTGNTGFVGFLFMLASMWLLFVMPLAGIRDWWRNRKS